MRRHRVYHRGAPARVVAAALACAIIGCKDAPSTQSGPAEAGENARMAEQVLAMAQKGKGKGKGRGRVDDDANKPKAYKVDLPAPKRTFYVTAKAESDGDGSEANPWNDLQAALCRLEPGDRLIMLKGSYRGGVAIDAPCKEGTADAPIQVYAHEDATMVAGKRGQPTLVIRKPFWVFQHLEVMSGKSRAPAIVTEGPGAHDILLEEIHPHNGWSHGIVIGRDTRRLTIANSHIHNFGHPAHGKNGGCIQIEDGAAEINLIGNEIHTSMAGALLAGGRTYGIPRPDGTVEAPPGVTLRENKIQNNVP